MNDPHDLPPEIAPPRGDRPPLKVNVFAAMQHGNTQLMPLFPYVHPGAMVPAGAILRGGPDADYGHFFHHNTQDEVVVALAANGCVLATGQVYVGGRKHGVNSFLKKEKDPAGYSVQLITQVQVESGPQTEACSLRCDKCLEEVFLREFDATPQPDGLETEIPFPSIAVLTSLIEEFNADPALRTCRHCGHVSRPFPIRAWGWDRYVDQTGTTARGRADLLQAAGARGPAPAAAPARAP